MNPLLAEEEDAMNATLYRILDRKSQYDEVTEAGIVYTIPVVVHIIHEGGPENVSDSFVIASINNLNLRFQNAAPFYDSTGHEVNIQFCLASIDPQGNPTTGITRDSSSLTWHNAGNDGQLKNLNRWDPEYYYNIWTVKVIFGFPFSVVGYSSLPSSAGDSTDGVVIIGSYLDNTTLTHESGHYLGLYHTFSYLGCSNFNCLLEGDHVCDTPPDTSGLSFGCMANSCNTDVDDTTGIGPFTSDVNELPNYMDYTTCPLSFSQGQADRMEASLVNIRSSLLQSFGCGFPGGALPDAQISYSASPCNDGIVYFSDSLSLNALTTNWDFENDGIYDSFLDNATYVYPATGTYTVKLLVTGPGGIDSVTQTIFVQKSPSRLYPVTTINGIFINLQGDTATCSSFTFSLSGPPSAQSYLWSTGETTQSISFVPDSNFTIWLSIVDSAGLSWTNQLCHLINVVTSDPPPVPVIYTNDSLTICDGDSVTFHSIINGTGNYTYQWYQNGNSISGANDSTYTAIGFFPGIQYILIISDSTWCHSYSNVLNVYSFGPPPQQSLTQNNYELISGWGNGNQWYLDGVPINGATGTNYIVNQPGCYSVAWFLTMAPACSTMSDTICFLSVEIDSPDKGPGDFIITPNPADHHLIISHSGVPGIINSFRLLNMLGELVKIQDAFVSYGHQEIKFDISDLPAGLYVLQLTVNRKVLNNKVLIE